MRLSALSVENYARFADVNIGVRRHLVVVGANDVGKTSLLRLLNVLFGSTAGMYQSLCPSDLRDPDVPLVVAATFEGFTPAEKAAFFKEINVDLASGRSTLTLRLEARVDPDDSQAVSPTRFFAGAADTRSPTREHLDAIGWRYLPALRPTSSAQFDGPNGAAQVLLKAIEPSLGGEREALERLRENFDEQLAASTHLGALRNDVADRLSEAMPRRVEADDLSFRATSSTESSVLENVSLYVERDGDTRRLSEMSDGVRALAAMTLFDLSEGAANVIAIDEPELHLHPASQRTVAGLLTNDRNQKIVVTHSPFIIQRFDPADVLVVAPDGTSRQLPEGRLDRHQRNHALWWSPQMLEALTARTVVLVEGVADRVILEAAANLRGMSLDRLGAHVFALGGADNFPAVYDLLGPKGFNIPLLGLVDQAESAKWVGKVIDAAGGKPKSIVGTTVFISDSDLEHEYCRGLGAPFVASALIAAGTAPERSILASCGAAQMADVTVEPLAAYCRKDGRKVHAALAVASQMSTGDLSAIASITALLDRLDQLHEQ